MDNYCVVQLSSCVKGELILLKANLPYLYAYLLSKRPKTDLVI